MMKTIVMILASIGVVAGGIGAFGYFTDGGLSTTLYKHDAALNEVASEERKQFMTLWSLSVQETANPTPLSEEAVTLVKSMPRDTPDEGSHEPSGTGTKPTEKTPSASGSLNSILDAKAKVDRARNAARDANSDAAKAKELCGLVTAINDYNKTWTANFPKLNDQDKVAARDAYAALKTTINKQDLTGGYSAFGRILGDKKNDATKDKLNAALETFAKLDK